MDHYISMYIDNELSLEEKTLFIQHVFTNEPYKDEALSLLEQEKTLRASLLKEAPDVELKALRPAKIIPFFGRYLGWAVAACLVVFFSFYANLNINHQENNSLVMSPVKASHRFLIHDQNSSRVEITGSFTNWERIPLSPTGTIGYWEIYLDLPEGEHRYSFIIDGSQYIPDPTIPARETDDFGSTNSILKVEA